MPEDYEELREIRFRLTQVEVAMVRLISILNGHKQAVEAAAHTEVWCECGKDVACSQSCEQEFCAWGLPPSDEDCSDVDED